MINQYNRYFINLVQNDSQYTLNGKEAIGRCKVETKANKGKIYIWAQNLKAGTYDIYLINSNRNKFNAIKIGELKIDSRGYAELNFEFDTENILNKEIPINSIDVIALTPKNNKKIIVMEGYKNNKTDWHDNFNNEEKKDKNNEEKNNTEKKITDNKKNMDETEPKIETEKVQNIQPQITDEKEETVAKSKSDSQNLIVESVEKFKDIAEKINKELEQLKNYRFMSEEEIEKLEPKNKNNFCLEYIFENNIPMSPFEKQTKEIKWVRLAIQEMICLPIDFWLYANHPFIYSAYCKNKHMILGRNSEEYILGLPDKYQPEYKGLMSKLGFIQFKCCKDKKPMREDYGYWLMPIYF